MDCFSPQILVFLKGFKDDEQKKLAIELGIILANGFCKAQVLTSVFEEHLVKEGKNPAHLGISVWESRLLISRQIYCVCKA